MQFLNHFFCLQILSMKGDCAAIDVVRRRKAEPKRVFISLEKKSRNLEEEKKARKKVKTPLEERRDGGHQQAAFILLNEGRRNLKNLNVVVLIIVIISLSRQQPPNLGQVEEKRSDKKASARLQTQPVKLPT